MGLALGRAKIVPITTDQKADPGKPCWEYVRGRDRTRRKKTMFVVIKTGGRQYRVVPDDVLEIGKIAGDVGTIVQLGEVLVVGGDTPVLGRPTVAGASVAAEVLDHKRGPKVIAKRSRFSGQAPVHQGLWRRARDSRQHYRASARHHLASRP